VAHEVFPPTQISLPPLRVYTFIPVTGQIISRQVVVEQGSPESAEGAVPALPAPAAKAKAKAAAVGAGSAAGLQPPPAPNPVGPMVAGGKSNVDGKEAADDDVDGEEEEEEEGEVDLEAELKKLETLQRGKKKKKGSAGQNVEPKAKKPKAK
jgi:hypothetical protein